MSFRLLILAQFLLFAPLFAAEGKASSADAPAPAAVAAADSDKPEAAHESAATIAARTDYVLQPGDLIRVVVFQEDDLTRDVRVSKESTITLPLIGGVDLKGKTPHEAQEMIRALYDRDYLVNPQVNVIVTEYSRRSVNVIGSVNTPGVVLFPQEEGLTLLDAITRAGGFSRLADKRRIKLTRTLSDGKVENYTINADEIIEGTAKDQWNLLKDDVIFVPERVL